MVPQTSSWARLWPSLNSLVISRRNSHGVGEVPESQWWANMTLVLHYQMLLALSCMCLLKKTRQLKSKNTLTPGAASRVKRAEGASLLTWQQAAGKAKGDKSRHGNVWRAALREQPETAGTVCSQSRPPDLLSTGVTAAGEELAP